MGGYGSGRSANTYNCTVEDCLDIDISMLECGSTYKQNSDGSFDLLMPDLDIEPDYDPHPTYNQTGKPEENKLVETYGDNSWIEVESDKIDNYDDLDDMMFSYTKTFPIKYGVSAKTSIDQFDVDTFNTFESTDGESYKLDFTLNVEFVYITIPINLNEYDFLLNGLTVVLEETTQEFVLDGTLYTTLVYRSMYKINGDVVLDMIPKDGRI